MAVKRLDRLLSELGVATRSELRQIIKSGRVTVDGAAAARPDMKIEEQGHSICVDGAELCTNRLRYFMMDKPEGVLSATEDKRQETVLDILPPDIRLFPVGRLDKDTSGLLLLTNDGDFAHRVISPKSGIEKLYYAEVDGTPDEADVKAFEDGIVLGDGTKCLPLGGNRCHVIVMEGKYHQVKRMFASRGKPVVKLRRLAVGALELDPALAPGGVKELGSEDIAKVLGSFILDN